MNKRHGWSVGNYVVMPDHVHFFMTALNPTKSMSQTIGLWKQWTNKRLRTEANITIFKWQAGFFDHVLRSEKSYSEKWDYVSNNPIRAGLVKRSDDWPYQGFVDFK